MSALFHGGLVLAVAWAVSVGAAQRPSRPVLSGAAQPLDVARLLDTYAAGRFDEAVAWVAQAGDQAGRALRASWKIDA